MKIRAILAVLACAVLALCSLANARMAEAGARASHVTRSSQPEASTQNVRPASFAAERPVQAGTATKTRCVKAATGRVEDTVCMTVAISQEEAMYYFQRANDEGSQSKK